MNNASPPTRRSGQFQSAFQNLALAVVSLPPVRWFRNTAPGRSLFNAAYWQYKAWIEVPGTGVLSAYLPPGTWAIDVGANVGFFTLKFARWASDGGKVLAFEPEDRNFARLRILLRRKGLSDVVDARHAAAASTTGPIRLKVNPDHPGDHSLTTEGGIVIDGIAIDDAVAAAGSPHVALIKIDTQGAEQIVLDGARLTIARCRPALFIEIDDEALRGFGASAESVLRFLEEQGYGFSLINRAGVVPTTAGDILRHCTAGQGTYLDVLCLARVPAATRES